MTTKAEKTRQFILETIAPVFNKHGYFGTSMSDITKATGLTKGAIYGNFKDKEELALEVFNYNLRRVIGIITEKVQEHSSPLMQLRTIIDSYRKYYEFALAFGGCPIINVGVDANNQNPALLARVRHVIGKLQGHMARMIREGIECGEIREGVEPDRIAGRIFAAIEGGVFVSVIQNDGSYLVDMMNHMDEMIDRDLKI